ncbi:MAG: 16S rRNA (uracil(1498)-N(3))-methyltransferase [Verrucomicrobiales bacterium]|nr:16S rRNA (uracil(1498)-N(3))-methyltransferase [Verrucomicrobiales bacterium]
MHRFFVAPEQVGAERVTLDSDESHHAIKVLRLQYGDTVELLDGAGRILEGRIASTDRRAVGIEVSQVRRQPAPPPVALAPALIKGRAMDWMIQKATELGATAISPLVLDRSVVRVAATEADTWMGGWRTTCLEACKQCGNAWMPRLDPPRTLEAFLHRRRPGLLVVASLLPEAGEARRILNSTEAVETVTLVIGPEGDFSERESAALLAAGARPMSLGPLVLRAETAATAGLAVLQHELACRPIKARQNAGERDGQGP